MEPHSKKAEDKKPKLPRKRKKKAIKAQGRKWYYDTIKLHGILQEQGQFYEPYCKFWVNESLTPGIFGMGIVMMPTQYW